MKINVGILTLSDKGSIGEREDISGNVIKEKVKEINGEVTAYKILPDEKDKIKNQLLIWCQPNSNIDLILTTGGTGFSKRDVTPDATLEVIDKPVPGIAEAIRYEGYKKVKKAILSRGVSGIKNNTLIINLPGSIKGVTESLEAIIEVIPHGIEILKGVTSECGQG